MKTEMINDYGQRNGYPIYVFDDGTVAPYRQPGKNLLMRFRVLFPAI